MSGIYKICNLITGKIYIGSTSREFKHRKYDHWSSLRTNKHHNHHLQSAWNKDGEQNFVFEIIEECEKQSLVEREQYYLDVFKAWDRKIGYNKGKNAELSSLGVKKTKKWKQNHSNTMKGKLAGEKHPLTKFTWDTIKNIRQSYNSGRESYQSLARQYNTQKGTIVKIIKNINWTNSDYSPPIKEKKWLPRLGLNSKINFEQVLEIRNKKQTCSVEQISKIYNISKQHVYRILNNECWGDNT